MKCESAQSALWTFRLEVKKLQKSVEKNCSTCILNVMIESIRGIWWIDLLHMWSAVTCSTGHARFCTNWHVPKGCRNAVLQLLVHSISSEKATLTTRSNLPKLCSMTKRI